MTEDEFRAAALSLPEAVEGAHMGHPDFRVGGRIFATLWPGQDKAVLMLTPEDQRIRVDGAPGMFAPVKGGWGAKGATELRLSVADPLAVQGGLAAAWRKIAPRRLVS